jgi:hypothetical protein
MIDADLLKRLSAALLVGCAIAAFLAILQAAGMLTSGPDAVIFTR